MTVHLARLKRGLVCVHRQAQAMMEKQASLLEQLVVSHDWLTTELSEVCWADMGGH